MSEAKFTRGPWKVWRDNKDKWYTRRVYAGNDWLVANVLDGHEANACLIATAPELLEVLERALDHSNCPGDNCAIDWHAQARAAIAKAKGGPQ
jgi:hypothetical protein